MHCPPSYGRINVEPTGAGGKCVEDAAPARCADGAGLEKLTRDTDDNACTADGLDAVVNVTSRRDVTNVAKIFNQGEGLHAKTNVMSESHVAPPDDASLNGKDGKVENPLHVDSAVHSTPRLVSVLATGNTRNQNAAAEKLVMLIQLHGQPIRKAAHDAGATHLLTTLVLMNAHSLQGTAGQNTYCMTALADLIYWYDPAKQEYINFCLNKHQNGESNLSLLIGFLSTAIASKEQTAYACRDLLLAMVLLGGDGEHVPEATGAKSSYHAKLKASISECGIMRAIVDALHAQLTELANLRATVACPKKNAFALAQPSDKMTSSVKEHIKLINALARLDPLSAYRKLSWQQGMRLTADGRQDGGESIEVNGLVLLLWTAIIWCQQNTQVASISLNVVRDAILNKQTRRAAVLCVSNQRVIESLSENLLAVDIAIVPEDVQTSAAQILASIVELEGPALQQRGIVQVLIDVALPRACEILHRSARESTASSNSLHKMCALLVARLIVASHVCCHAVLFHTQILDIVVRTLVRACEYVLAKNVLAASGLYAAHPTYITY